MKKEDFEPISPEKVTFYQCGPTVYSHQHIGNMQSALRGDLIRRSLEYLGFRVLFTRNITDVGHLVSDEDEGEDKMEKGAKKEGLTPTQISEKYSNIYHIDLEKLNVLPPTFETKATKYIPQMIDMVQILLDKGFAYATDKAIYFDVSKFPDYNNLNGQNLEMNIHGSGHGIEEDQEKIHPYDFAIWFFKAGAHKGALQTWEHKFSGIDQKIEEGFPGWHIECSAMSKDTLGDTIDIHMGGMEHIPVHHTNEIAQSESANGVRFVNYWLHHEMLEIDGGKMSKSKGNVYSLDDLIKKGIDPLTIRYFFLLAHYRSKQNFTFEALDAANTAYKRMIKLLQGLQNEKGGKIIEIAKRSFISALEDDINIPKAVSIVWDVLKDKTLADEDKFVTVLDFDRVLGLNLQKRISQEIPEEKPSEEILKLLLDRDEARAKKNWTESDRIREELKTKYNYNVVDKI
jgi:cysteinyl-tRNA synthetase